MQDDPRHKLIQRYYGGSVSDNPLPTIDTTPPTAEAVRLHPFENDFTISLSTQNHAKHPKVHATVEGRMPRLGHYRRFFADLYIELQYVRKYYATIDSNGLLLREYHFRRVLTYVVICPAVARRCNRLKYYDPE